MLGFDSPLCADESELFSYIKQTLTDADDEPYLQNVVFCAPSPFAMVRAFLSGQKDQDMSATEASEAFLASCARIPTALAPAALELAASLRRTHRHLNSIVLLTLLHDDAADYNALAACWLAVSVDPVFATFRPQCIGQALLALDSHPDPDATSHIAIACIHHILGDPKTACHAALAAVDTASPQSPPEGLRCLALILQKEHTMFAQPERKLVTTPAAHLATAISHLIHGEETEALREAHTVATDPDSPRTIVRAALELAHLIYTRLDAALARDMAHILISRAIPPRRNPDEALVAATVLVTVGL